MFRIIKEFIKNNHYVFIWYVLTIITLISVSFLYQRMGDPIYYSIVLITFSGCVFGMRAFLVFYKKVKEIEKARENLSEASVILPVSNRLVEEEYKELVRALEEQRNACIVKNSKEQQERDMYYTMWIHQIKTPIAALQLLLQNASKPDIVPQEIAEISQTEYSDFIKKMEQELFKVEQYAEMALQYQRIQNIGEDLSFKELPIKSIIMKAVKKYSVLFIYKSIRIKFGNLEGNVLTDEKWFLFMLEQVISNALKYTKAGGEISCLVDDNTLFIADTGIGIQAEDLTRIFERGFTGFNGRMFQKSTGIGLFLCKQIADKLVHPLSITSKVGVGTTVMIGFAKDKLELID